jgi:NAD(P)-dependent dehydrogenase (short-subunit alcohol dehydrogenase family)
VGSPRYEKEFDIMNRFDRQTVVVTGGGSGLGAAACERFASEGGDLIVVDKDLNSAQEVTASLKRQGHAAIALECDVSDEASIKNLFAAISTHTKHLDVIFSNAGMPCPEGIEELASERWDKTFAVNARSNYLMVKYSLPLLENGRGRSIVFTSSAAGLIAMGSQPAYSASKGAVVALTKALANELKVKQIRVNSICPGWVNTPMMNQFYEENFPDPKSRMEAITDSAFSLPMRRFADSNEIAAAAAFLASSDASYITGISLPVDGGLTSISS